MKHHSVIRVSWKFLSDVCVCAAVIHMVPDLWPGWKPLSAPPPALEHAVQGAGLRLLAPNTHGRSPEHRPGVRPAEWRRTGLCSCHVCLECLNSTATELRHSREVVTQRPPCLPPSVWCSCGAPVSCPGHSTLHGFSPCRAQAVSPYLSCVSLPRGVVPLLGSLVKFSSGCELPLAVGSGTPSRAMAAESLSETMKASFETFQQGA